jgi:flavin-dependent dehydrogenase
MGTRWAAGDTMSSLGYFIPAVQNHVDLRFFSGFEGYIWVFPRADHLSVGIAGKGRSASVMREMLHRYLAENGISTRGATFYGHVIPSLTKPAWRDNRVAGDGWLAVGDAAGLVDPVTGEGLYYAVRSADLAAEAILRDAGSPEVDYRRMLWHDCGEDLEVAARLCARFYLGRLAFGSVTTRLIQLARRSPTLCAVLQDLFAGNQKYLDLKQRLLEARKATAFEVLLNRRYSHAW